MKKKYKNLEIEIIELEDIDIITASGTESAGGSGHETQSSGGEGSGGFDDD